MGSNGNDYPGCGGETSSLVSRTRGKGGIGGRMDQRGKVGRTCPKRETFLGEMTESWKLFRSLFTEIAAR